jgi:hypothetical protein
MIQRCPIQWCWIFQTPILQLAPWQFLIFRHLFIKIYISRTKNEIKEKKVLISRTHVTYLASLFFIGVRGLFHADWLGAGR